MKKRKIIEFLLLSIIVWAVCCLPLFAHGGVLAGSAGNLFVIQTTYFDIIYPQESVAAAEKIAVVCDRYYENLCKSFLMEPYQRFPVTISHSIERLNASFSLYPYNHIVLYDTPPENSLDMHEQTLENIFYHELTHAVTGNIKNPQNRFLSGIFGDIYSPAFFASTQFWIEGVAVEAESRGMSGRLYDPYSTLLAVQAKIDGRFPSWRDVTGARDIYPGGTDAYIFGALFSRYLSEVYGYAQYAAYWQSLAFNTQTIATSSSPKKRPKYDIFTALTGKHMNETWKDFEAWLSVPEQVLSGEDFFLASGIDAKADKQGFSRQNNRLQLFSAIDTAPSGVVWAERKTGGVWYAAFSNGRYEKPRKLFTAESVSRLSLSADGRFVAASYLYDKRTVKTAVCVYDIEKGSLVTLPIASARDAAFLQDESGKLLLSCVQTSCSPYAIEVYLLGEAASFDARSCSLVQRVTLSAGEYAYSPADAGQCHLACIIKRGLDWKIRIYAPDEKGQYTHYCEYGTEKTIVHNLHGKKCADGRQVLTFSYAPMGSDIPVLPRAGLLYLDKQPGAEDVAELCLLESDIAGGMTDAVILPSALKTGKETLLYLAESYECWRLMQLDVASVEVNRKRGASSAFLRVTESVSAQSEDPESPVLTESASQFRTSSYNPFRYAKKGLFIPFLTTIQTYNKNLSPNFSESAYFGVPVTSGYCGGAFLTANPWGDHFLIVSAGWDWNAGAGANIQFSGGDDALSYSYSGSVVGDDSGLLQTSEHVSVAHALYARYGNSISCGLTGACLYGYGISYDEDADIVLSAQKDWAATGRLYTSFSTVHKRAPGYFQYGGVYAKPFLFAAYTDIRSINVGLTIGARIPGAIPLSLSATLFPETDCCVQGGVSAMLFSYEVQKAIPGIYTDRVYISGSYSSKIAYTQDSFFDIVRVGSILQGVTKDDYTDTLQLKTGIMAAINAGCLSYATLDVSTFVQYHPHIAAGKKRIAGGVGLEISY